MARQLAKLLEGEGVLFIEGEKHPYLTHRAAHSHKY
jgi:hypothetical protein